MAYVFTKFCLKVITHLKKEFEMEKKISKIMSELVAKDPALNKKAALAGRLGISEQYVKDILSEKFTPGLHLAMAIRELYRKGGE